VGADGGQPAADAASGDGAPGRHGSGAPPLQRRGTAAAEAAAAVAPPLEGSGGADGFGGRGGGDASKIILGAANAAAGAPPKPRSICPDDKQMCDLLMAEARSIREVVITTEAELHLQPLVGETRWRKATVDALSSDSRADLVTLIDRARANKASREEFLQGRGSDDPRRMRMMSNSKPSKASGNVDSNKKVISDLGEFLCKATMAGLFII